MDRSKYTGIVSAVLFSALNSPTQAMVLAPEELEKKEANNYSIVSLKKELDLNIKDGMTIKIQKSSINDQSSKGKCLIKIVAKKIEEKEDSSKEGAYKYSFLSKKEENIFPSTFDTYSQLKEYFKGNDKITFS